jgi:hypothetical protein
MSYLETMFYVLIGWALASVPFGILAGRVAGWADREAVEAMTAAMPTEEWPSDPSEQPF